MSTASPALKDLDVVILCGGLGTRLREETETRPKPMVEIGGKPILWHIMTGYARYGVRSFILCLGYKGDVVRDYFLNYRHRRSDVVVELRNNIVEIANGEAVEDWRITLVETGQATQTGARLRQGMRYARGSRFLATYGDGVSDVDLDALYAAHTHNGLLATVTAVHPAARFGEIVASDNRITAFHEKPQVTSGWVNGGFFVFEKEAFARTDDRADLSLEHHVLPDLVARQQLASYLHKGFWQCMDTFRDMQLLNDLWASGDAPWMPKHGA